MSDIPKIHPQLLFKATPPDLKKYIGKKVKIPERGEVVIETICGNIGMTLGSDRPQPHYYEINGEHLLSMLRFHAQMTGASDITEDQFQAFEEMEFHAEKMDPKKDMKEVEVEQVH